jgi:LuxR family transcriptional regulator, maltose regulon positive regulatory protein
VRIVTGPPGAGKSTLLVALADHLGAHQTVWINIDAADRDPVRFWQAVIISIRRLVPAFGEEAFDLLTLDDGVEPDTLESLLVDAEQLPQPITVVLDDLHRAGDEIAEQLRLVIERRSSCLRFVLGSRHEPAVGRARLRLGGRLVEIGEADLRFEAAETARLARTISGPFPLNAEEAALLHRRTEGWVAGIVLAALALRDQHDPGTFLERLAGTNLVIAPYLSAELVDAQPPEVRAFLFDTCVVDELNDDLAAALADGSTVRLTDLAERHLLLQRLDPDGRTFRYHHLFSDLLRTRLRADDPAHEATLHRRAADWYERHGDLASCFRHRWRAGDRSEALGLLQTSALDEYLAGRHPNVHAITGTLRDADLRDDPDSVVGLVATLALEGRVEEASSLADRLESVAGSQLSEAAQLRLLGGRCFESAQLGDVERCVAASDELLRRTSPTAPTDAWIDAGISIGLRARAWAGLVEGAEEIVARLPTKGPNLLEAVDHQSSVAQLRLAEGRFDDAERRCRSALAALEGVRDKSSDLAVLPRAVLGSVLLERGDLTGARAQFGQVLEVASATRRPATVLALIGLARILRYEGEHEAARRLLEEGRDLLRHAPASSPMLVPIAAGLAHAMLARGEHRQARTVIAAMPECVTRGVLEATLHASVGELPEARAALEGSPPPRVPLEALDLALAALAVVLQDPDAPVAEPIDAVLDLAEPMEASFPIAEAGREVLAAVAAAARRRPQAPFLDAVQRSRPPAGPQGAAVVEFALDALSERERTVLRYLATSMSYREIAADLYVSVNTVKTHVKNILRKLQASSRAEAIERAHHLDYL